MGATWSQQGCLRISPEQGLVARENLEIDKEYPFQKSDHRLYMLDIPMDLMDRDWQVMAKIVITEITVGHGQTKGIYKVLKIYTDEESKIISNTMIPFEGAQ